MECLVEFKKKFKKSEFGSLLIKNYVQRDIFEIQDGLFVNNVVRLAYEMFMEKTHFVGLKKDISLSKKITDRYLKSAKERHGDNFDYDTIKFYGADIEIYCNGHNDTIRIRRDNHLKSGCKVCFFNSKRHDIIDLKTELSYIWQNEYSYENTTDYKNSLTPLKITCKHHGIFTLTCTEHKNKRVIGCGECYRDPLHKERYIKLQKEALERQIEWKEGKVQHAHPKR